MNKNELVVLLTKYQWDVMNIKYYIEKGNQEEAIRLAKNLKQILERMIKDVRF